MDETIDYYERNAEAFERDTVGLDMESLYGPFLKLVPTGGRILDSGCGPGRDMKAFLDRGYDVVGFDASPRMVELAAKRTGKPIIQMRFEEMEFEEEFDGVWACASLLHVPRGDLEDAFRRLLRAARRGGVIYVSFKYGAGDRVEQGRRFSDFTEQSLGVFLGELQGTDPLRIWRTVDVRPGRRESWVNALLTRL